MGQKVHPKGLRVGVIYDWDSRWFARKNFAELLLEDKMIRDFIKDRLRPVSYTHLGPGIQPLCLRCWATQLQSMTGGNMYRSILPKTR